MPLVRTILERRQIWGSSHGKIELFEGEYLEMDPPTENEQRSERNFAIVTTT